MRTTLLAVCCVTLLVLVGCGESDSGGTPSEGPPQGTNEASTDGSADAFPDEVVLAMTPPSGWESAKLAPDSEVLIHYPPGADDAPLANLQLSSYTIWMLDEKNLAGAVKRYIDGMKGWESIMKNFTVVSSEPLQVGDVSAQEIYWTTETFGGADKPFKGRTWIAVSKSDVWQVIAAFQPADFDAHAPLLDAVAKSLRWEAAPEEPDEE